MSNKTYITPEWPAPKNIRAYTTTRDHGNIATYVDDNPDVVVGNITRLVEDLQLPETPVWLRQVHGDRAVRIDEQTESPEADASYTQQRHTVCAVLTADCIPLLVCNRDGTEVAAIHAGWQGLLVNVINASINALTSSPEDLLVWMGPALSQKNFEMGNEIYANFLNANPDYASAFQRQNNKWYLDGYAIAKKQLQDANVNAVYSGDYCTYDDKRFYSYRRDRGNTGRMTSLIYMT